MDFKITNVDTDETKCRMLDYVLITRRLGGHLLFIEIHAMSGFFL